MSVKGNYLRTTCFVLHTIEDGKKRQFALRVIKIPIIYRLNATNNMIILSQLRVR